MYATYPLRKTQEIFQNISIFPILLHSFLKNKITPPWAGVIHRQVLRICKYKINVDKHPNEDQIIKETQLSIFNVIKDYFTDIYFYQRTDFDLFREEIIILFPTLEIHDFFLSFPQFVEELENASLLATLKFISIAVHILPWDLEGIKTMLLQRLFQIIQQTIESDIFVANAGFSLLASICKQCSSYILQHSDEIAPLFFSIFDNFLQSVNVYETQETELELYHNAFLVILNLLPSLNTHSDAAFLDLFVSLCFALVEKCSSFTQKSKFSSLFLSLSLRFILHLMTTDTFEHFLNTDILNFLILAAAIDTNDEMEENSDQCFVELYSFSQVKFFSEDLSLRALSVLVVNLFLRLQHRSFCCILLRLCCRRSERLHRKFSFSSVNRLRQGARLRRPS